MTIPVCKVSFNCIKCGHSMTLMTFNLKSRNCHQCGQGYTLAANGIKFGSLVYYKGNLVPVFMPREKFSLETDVIDSPEGNE